MKVLHNRFSNKELKRLMLEEKESRVTISFYKYFHLEDPQQFRDELYIKLYEIDVFGRVYIASEGINGQISVPESRKNTFKEILYNAHPQLNGIRLNEALDNDGK